MREKLIQYVELLFAGSTVHDEVRQEILQNTLDRFDDLVDQGKSPEAAYQLAISGIGDINEILGTMAASPAPAQPEAPKKWSRKLVSAIAVALFILCPVPVLTFQNELGVCLLLAFVGIATGLLVWVGDNKAVEIRQRQQEDWSQQSELHRSISHLMTTLTWVLYLVLSFSTGAWFITWVIFPISAAVKGLIRAIWDLKEADNHET
ncbi:MAG: permease prefix domain 1-containing protein [Eubacteriales bacterium]|nr:permease prefix domain 1-containing protein [Eubacteriales bacterium]